MIRVIVEQSVPYLKGIIERYATPIYLDNHDITKQHIRDAQAMVVRSITQCNASLLAGTQIEYIATATAGTDHIDDKYCEQAHIHWDSTPGCNAIAVAQYVFSSLSLLSLREGIELQGKTIGIIGVGHVGKQVQRIAEILGMRVLLNDPPRARQEGEQHFVNLSRIQEEADIITLHVPLTEETRHLVDETFLSLCKKKPVLINACRGAVCSSSALIKAKQQQLISHLIIDCWENEPNINPDLLTHADIASPHIAGFSADGKHRGARMALIALCLHFGIEVDEKALLEPNELTSPSTPINLSVYPEGEEIQRAFLATFNPQDIDLSLRNHVANFEYLRKHYNYPREMAAHCIMGGSAHGRELLSCIGFKLI